MPAAAGVALRSVHRIWTANRLPRQPVHRFKLSQNPAFATS
jgi:hypothetical protein